MGTYTARDFLDTFGGLPEPGECATDPDAVRDELEGRSRPAPCGGLCPPEGCWFDRCLVGHPSEDE